MMPADTGGEAMTITTHTDVTIAELAVRRGLKDDAGEFDAWYLKLPHADEWYEIAGDPTSAGERGIREFWANHARAEANPDQSGKCRINWARRLLASLGAEFMTFVFEPEPWTEEEALAQGMTHCAVCEEWGTVPGSTRCQDCQEDET
jgi:hypothetical protein